MPSQSGFFTVRVQLWWALVIDGHKNEQLWSFTWCFYYMEYINAQENKTGPALKHWAKLKSLLSWIVHLHARKGNSQVWDPGKFSQESNVTYLNEGGMYSGGRTGGSGWPDMATSIRCIARMNSSAVSFPSWSMSERFLIQQKIHAIQFTKMHASYYSPVICKFYFLTLILSQQNLFVCQLVEQVLFQTTGRTKNNPYSCL